MHLGRSGAVAVPNGIEKYFGGLVKVARPLYHRSSGSTSGRVDRRRTIAAAQPMDDADDQPPVIGDWREFKSRLITLDTGVTALVCCADASVG